MPLLHQRHDGKVALETELLNLADQIDVLRRFAAAVRRLVPGLPGGLAASEPTAGGGTAGTGVTYDDADLVLMQRWFAGPERAAPETTRLQQPIPVPVPAGERPPPRIPQPTMPDEAQAILRVAVFGD